MKGQEISVPPTWPPASRSDRRHSGRKAAGCRRRHPAPNRSTRYLRVVAANGRLRQLVNDGAQKLGAQVYLPLLKFCGDNGAMIASQGYYEYIAGHTAGLDLNGLPTLPIDYQ